MSFKSFHKHTYACIGCGVAAGGGDVNRVVVGDTSEDEDTNRRNS